VRESRTGRILTALETAPVIPLQELPESIRTKAAEDTERFLRVQSRAVVEALSSGEEVAVKFRLIVIPRGEGVVSEIGGQWIKQPGSPRRPFIRLGKPAGVKQELNCAERANYDPPDLQSVHAVRSGLPGSACRRTVFALETDAVVAGLEENAAFQGHGNLQSLLQVVRGPGDLEIPFRGRR
jgi:hypothetical protein